MEREYHFKFIRGFKIGFVLFFLVLFLYVCACTFYGCADCPELDYTTTSDGWINYHKHPGPIINAQDYTLIGPFEPPLWCSDPAVPLMAMRNDSLFHVIPGRMPNTDSLFVMFPRGGLDTRNMKLYSRRLSLKEDIVITYFDRADTAWEKRLIWAQ